MSSVGPKLKQIRKVLHYSDIFNSLAVKDSQTTFYTLPRGRDLVGLCFRFVGGLVGCFAK